MPAAPRDIASTWRFILRGTAQTSLRRFRPAPPETQSLFRGRNVQFAPGCRNNRRRPRRSVREASNDRGFNGSGWPDFTWENGDISALPGRSRFPTDTFDHRCIRRRCPESLPLPRRRSRKYVNRSLLFRHALDCIPSSLEAICHG